ncbi:MAG: ABC transporter ATP-binding protein [Rubrivivax sp.]|jgi:branched-chain amino acid transport system ATP-binding protein|nr:ABC transporter ATP-binding protein [Rubrivivax sp.]
MLETRDLTIRFGGHVAVDAVSCRFEPGTLTAIVGPNGAGKTSYFNLISGQLPASAGQVLLDGEDLSALPAPLRTRKGLGRAFQLTQLFPNLSVLENVRLAVQAREQGRQQMRTGPAWQGGLDLFKVWLDRQSWIDEAQTLLRQVQLAERADQPAAALPHGDQRKLEVALLMALDPKVYLFDEPTAGMSVDDAPVVLDLIRALKTRRDRTILLVEHKMDVVRELSDRIVVLHNGRLVADGAPAAVMASPIVQQAYLGVGPEDHDGAGATTETAVEGAGR